MKIFVASTGRCGTRFMRWVFREYTAVPAFHEPDPKLNGHDMAEINSGRISPGCKKRIEEKFRFIDENTKDGYYFESSCAFIKSWAELALDRYGPDVGIIYIRRDLANLLVSWTRRGKRGRKGRFQSAFMLDPETEGTLLPGFTGMSFYERAAWNYFEVAGRFYHLRNNGLGSRISRSFEMEFKNLNDPETWRNLFRTFDVQVRKEIPDKWPESADFHRSIFAPESRISGLDHLEEFWDRPAEPIPPDYNEEKK